MFIPFMRDMVLIIGIGACFIVGVVAFLFGAPLKAYADRHLQKAPITALPIPVEYLASPTSDPFTPPVDETRHIESVVLRVPGE